jgi:hypothetical protein
LIFVNVGENLVMVDNAITPWNPLVALVEEKKLEEITFDVNVSQR